MAFGDEFLNRFGPYRLQPYDVPLYMGGAVGGAPAGGQINVPGTNPQPAGNGNGPGNGGTGTPGGPGNPSVPSGTGSGSGIGVGGNAGGASHGPGGGGGGDNAGHPGTNAAGLNGGLFGNMGPASYISLGPWGAGALQAASTLTPFPYSLAPTLASLAMRGYNTANTDAIRSSLNVPGLDFGQVLGSLLGLNDYGSLSGNQLVASKDQYSNPINNQPVGISTGGVRTDSYGPLGLFGSGALQTTYTPEEARMRQVMASAAATAPQLTAKQQAAADLAAYQGHQNKAQAANSGTSYQGVSGSGYSDRAGTVTGNGPLGAYGNPLGAGGSNQSGGMMSKGGFVPGRRDNIVDNRPINADEGEFVVRRAAAAAAGPRLLALMNDPRQARALRGVLGLR